MNKFNFKKHLFFSTFDVALMGLFFGTFLIIGYLKHQFLKGPLNISIEFLFWIIAGLIFGPIKGPIFAILADTFLQLMTGGMPFWMWQYAIIPPIITIISWAFYLCYKKLLNKPEINIHEDIKENNLISKKASINVFIFSLSLGLIALAVFICFSTYLFVAINLSFEKRMCILCVYILFLLYFIFYFCCVFSYNKFKKEFILNYVAQVSIIFFIMFFFRWLMGSYAYTEYFRRFFGAPKDNAFFLSLVSIASKSLITIPLLSLIIIPCSKTLEILRKKYSDNRYYY